MQTEYIIAATVKQHREDVCQETRLWFIKIKRGGGQNDTQDGCFVFFKLCPPVCAGYTSVCTRSVSSFLLCHSRLSGDRGDGAPRGSAM